MKAVSVILASTLFLAGCAGGGIAPGTDPSGVVVTSQLEAQVNNIIETVKRQCQWIPDAAAVADVLASFIPGAAPVTTVVSQVSKAICAQITTHGGQYGAPVQAVSINGIVVTGHYAARR